MNFVLFLLDFAAVWGGTAIVHRTNYKVATYGYTLIALPFVANAFLNYALYREQPDRADLTSSSYVVPAVVLDVLALLQYLFVRGAF
jgi:hypothetical protein